MKKKGQKTNIQNYLLGFNLKKKNDDGTFSIIK